MFSRILFLIVAFTYALSQSPQTAESSSADQIRSLHEEVDKTFQRHDPKQLATLFTPDCHFTALSIHVDGSDALERSHESLFLKRSDVILTDHTNRIVVNETWDVASEQGEWIERWTNKDGVTELRGTYLTMWKRDHSHWLAYSETMVPETCTGSSYCR